MKKDDIKVGAEYAQARGEWEYEGGSASRVRVTGLVPVQQGYGYRSKTVTGVAVEYLDRKGTVTHTGSVPTRQIREPWDAYVARHNAARERANEYRRQQREAQNERAKSLLDIIPALRHKGIEDTRRRLYTSDAILSMLLEHIPDCLEETTAEHGLMTGYDLVAPLADSIVNYVKSDAAFHIKSSDLVVVLR